MGLTHPPYLHPSLNSRAMASVIFEFKQVGNMIKVTAVDEQTGVEVSITGDPRATQKELENLAMKKLHYVLEKCLKEGTFR